MRTQLVPVVLAIGLAGCGERGREAPEPQVSGIEAAALPASVPFAVRETTLTATIQLAGVAAPVQQATLSTRLMGSVTEVRVREGQAVRAGEVLARVDTRDLEARRGQVQSAIAEAQAVRDDAANQAARFRSLYQDSAATKVQLEAVETGLARAEAGLRAARAQAVELQALRSYGDLRAPFAGRVTRRHVDPGAFVAPGTPIISIEDPSELRISAVAAPEAVGGLATGSMVKATVEGQPIEGKVEGVRTVPGQALQAVNVLVENRAGRLASGGAATLWIPQRAERVVLIPASAVIREGDLTGVRVRTPQGPELRWVRLGREESGMVEVLSGVEPGDELLTRRVPAEPEG